MREQRLIAGRGLASGVLALVVAGVVAVLAGVGWLWWMGRLVDGVARLRELAMFPGAAAIVVKDESAKGEQVGVLTFEVGAKVEDVYAFYDGELTNRGWQAVGRPSDGGGSGYTKRDGSFEGIEFTGGAGPDVGFPWVRIVTNRSPIWLDVDAVEVSSGGMGKTEVSIRVMEAQGK